ncbi:hypothetical protein ZIOFF_065540 [Zingiber officinale]|uniref:Uncharacterized protein n=1 Tax=Zingiber officinale TaxID=94328 RepID=A0A8J5F0I2_ZINOF|nr:hypothetical protein ZIOFF_065540 [Zingiber officinale]
MNGSRTLESRQNPETELELSQRRRASLVPTETLYSTNWNAGVNALIVLQDTHWKDDRSIIGTMEVDLSGNTPWEEDPNLDPIDLAPTNEDDEDLESYFLGLSNLKTDYPVIFPNSVLTDDNQQLPPYWDNSDTESDEYWQQVVEEVEQVEEQFYATQTNNLLEKMNELSVQEETSSIEGEPNNWLPYVNQDHIQSTKEAAHVGTNSLLIEQLERTDYPLRSMMQQATTEKALSSMSAISRSHIPNLSKLLRPLYSKTSPHGDRRFKSSDWAIIKEVKALVQTLPDLELPPVDAYIIIETDGSMEGWGGVCKWKQSKFDSRKIEKICAYAVTNFQ